jgi:formate hydrogenlyase subunit 6/NADH:ubiquinone oxidoreductase subunit I
MLTAFRRIFSSDRPRRRYPDDPGTPPAAFRGMPRLISERCRGHASCAEVCPSQALEVERVPDGWIWNHDRASCIACGLCIEACPEQALESSPAFELAARDRADLHVRVALSAGRRGNE